MLYTHICKYVVFNCLSYDVYTNDCMYTIECVGYCGLLCTYDVLCIIMICFSVGTSSLDHYVIYMYMNIYMLRRFSCASACLYVFFLRQPKYIFCRFHHSINQHHYIASANRWNSPFTPSEVTLFLPFSLDRRGFFDVKVKQGRGILVGRRGNGHSIPAI
jgi:hypothetical protein